MPLSFPTLRPLHRVRAAARASLGLGMNGGMAVAPAPASPLGRGATVPSERAIEPRSPGDRGESPAAFAVVEFPRFVVVPAAVGGWAGRSFGLVLKRALDLVGAGLLLVALAPFIVAIALAIRATGGPALFAQIRIGHGCRPFRMLKFRTMVPEAERLETVLARSRGRTFLKLKDDPRVTRLGRWLRKYSLDELPQLVNVLRGQMSLVGPRPLLLSDLERFPRQHQQRRFAMPPGLTGLWQVSGRSDLDDAERIRLDLAYVEEWSLGLDLKLLLRTVPVVLDGGGAY